MYVTFGKRWFDVSMSVLLMTVLSVPILVIVVLYLVRLQFPIFFIQKRVGWNGQVFDLYKFRTLKNGEGAEVNSRRFLWGDLLRFLSLDELPQLWNVLKGDMSFIGPRPLPVEYLTLYSVEQFKRHQVRPGITGWAQVNGRHSISWQSKFELDNYYVNHVSFRLDMLILFKTVVLLLSFRKDKSLAEEKFKGMPKP